MKKRINAMILVKHYEELQDIATNKGVSLSSALQMAIAEFIERNK